MLEDECQKEEYEIEEIADQKAEENEISEEIAKEKEKKQLQMTNFFVVKKNKLKLKMLFLLINCSGPLLVPS